MKKLRGLMAGKAIVGETAWSLVEQVLTIVASTATFLVLGRSLGASAYGSYMALNALMGPLFAFGHVGVSLAILEHIIREREAPRDVARSCMAIAAWFTILSGPLVVLVSAVALKSPIAVLTIAMLVLADLILMAFVIAQSAVVQALHGFTPAAKLRIIARLVRVAVIVGLWAADSLTLDRLAVAQIVTVGAQLVVVSARLKTMLGNHAVPGRVDRRHARSMAVYSFGIASSGVMIDSDKVVMDRVERGPISGAYAAAGKVLQMGMAPVLALAGVTHVAFLNAGEAAKNQVKKAQRFTVISTVYGTIFGISLWVTAPYAHYVLGDDYRSAAPILRWLSPVVALRAAGMFSMNGLLGLNRNSLRTAILMGNAALAVVLYLVLIPRYSWKGAIWATLINEAIHALAGWTALIACQRRASRRAAVGEQPELQPV